MRSIAIVLSVIAISVACQGGQSTSPQPQIIITSSMPTSATGGQFGIFEQTIQYAIDQQSTVRGYRIGYLSLDSSLGGNQSLLRGRENVERFVSDSRVLGMIGSDSSLLSTVEIPEANLGHLAMVSPNDTNSCLTVQPPGLSCTPTPVELRPTGINNFFRIAPRDPQQGETMGEFASTQLGRKLVATFNEFGPVGRPYVQEFATALSKHGGAVVYQEDASSDNGDFSNFLLQARARGADAVYAVGIEDPLDNLHICDLGAQMAVVMPGAYFLGTDGMTFDKVCIQHLGGAAQNVYATIGAVDAVKSADSGVRGAADALQKAHPFSFSASLYTPYVYAFYDCTRILIEAINRAIARNGGAFPSRAQVVTALTQPPEFMGLTGSYSFDANGDALHPMMSIYKVDAGKWNFVQVANVST